MGRLKRSHLPGMPFHITARAQGREPIFIGLESAVIHRIMEHAHYADVLLLAYAVMPNHFHLVIAQGARPLASFMQPLMRRLALLVMMGTKREGHVFERPYGDVACLNAAHLRNSLAYVALNGCRAGLCKSADDFAWCSHGIMSAAAETPNAIGKLQLGMETSLRMFATRHHQSLRACRDDYHAFLRWRIDMDRHCANGGTAEFGAPPAPDARAGDDFWFEQFGRFAPAPGDARVVRSVPNLRDMALTAIQQIAPGMDLEDLRSGGRGHTLVRVRRHLVARAVLAGHTPTTLARFLNIARPTISTLINRPARSAS